MGGDEEERRSLEQVPGRVEEWSGRRLWRERGVDLLGDNKQAEP